jgi:dipeptide/tripeptide permease
MAKHKYLTSPPNLTGMPPGVPYIIGNEAAERFSYYGMKSVLTVFMAHYILNQSGVLTPMNPNEAYMYTHYFVFGVYFLPIFGAIIADGWVGKYWTILSLSIAYCFGNLTLALMATSWGIAVGQRTMLVIGLTLICLGAGGIKPCVSANVGDQFGDSNKHLLSKMFGWFYFSINAGSFIAPSSARGSSPIPSTVLVGHLEFRASRCLSPLCSFGVVATKWCTCRRRGLVICEKLSVATVSSRSPESRWFMFSFWSSGLSGE